MDKKRFIHEAYWLRAISCLAVVTSHAVNTTLTNYEDSTTQFVEYVLIFIRFMVFFGTPTFVFISELILAHAYPNGIPKDFFIKRIKFLLLPFFFMALIFGFITTDSMTEALNQIFLNIFFGGFFGYFILIIFQFYVLHAFLNQMLNNLSPKPVLLVSFIINGLYLAYFNFTEPMNIPFGEQIWKTGYWVPFLGWFFYFCLGFYCGRHFEKLKGTLIKYKKILPLLPILFLIIIVILVRKDILIIVSSKRVDMILYTVSIIFVIISIVAKFKEIPKVILFISKYSFHIYLLHKIFLYYLQPISFLHPFLYFLLAYFYCIIGSIIVSIVLSRFTFSQYLIGKTLNLPPNKVKN
ncbi:acyltransferase family protein [Evansella sp. AB-P1]|uniref:acyltransferase family protein n=1 Tax=Evansella sp. AB-P1 TaxID=3037653 RepID=UPI00241FC29B|nr:acyltransferase family protein [Evansella sp. AB-P1]MDG5789530.1 acyltransferase family protein [Evansella sp. AB-P1]